MAKTRDALDELGRFAVLDESDLHISDGQMVPRTRAFTRIADLADAARALGFTQLWVTTGANDPLDFSPAGVGSWDLGKPAEQARDAFWLHMFDPAARNRSSVAIVRCAYDDKGLFKDVRDGGVLMRALRLYARLVGTPFLWSAGSTGTRLLRELHAVSGGLRLDAPGLLPEPARDPGVEIGLDWQRPLTSAERALRYVHSYDRNAQYLGAAASLRLGDGEPAHVSAAEIATRESEQGTAFYELPGYWRVRVDCCPRNAIERQLPPPYRVPRAGSLAWITSPTLTLLRELEWCDVNIVEAWVWPQYHRALEPWYKQLRAARQRLVELQGYQDAQIVLQLVKATYAHTSGYLAYPGSSAHDRTHARLYRPDWRHHWIAQARANLYRRIVRLALGGVVPFAVGKDALYFASDEPDARKACPPSIVLDDSLSGWKIGDGGVPMCDVLALLDEYRPNYLHELQIWLNCRAEGRVYEPNRRHYDDDAGSGSDESEAQQ